VIPNEQETLDTLLRLPVVSRCEVCATEGTTGEPRLVAFVVTTTPGSGASPLIGQIARAVPNVAVVVLDDLVPEPTAQPIASRSDRPDDAPHHTALEQVVADVLRTALDLDAIGIHDNFLDLGGSSLTAVEAVSRMSDMFELELQVELLFEYLTAAEFAAALLNAHPRPAQLLLVAECIARVLHSPAAATEADAAV
jgi:acyl carrier protein